MTTIGFFAEPAPRSVNEIAELVGGTLQNAAANSLLHGIAPLDEAGPGDLSFLDNPKYLQAAEKTNAGACLVGPDFASHLPDTVAGIIVEQPYKAFAKAASLFHPDAVQFTGLTADIPGRIDGQVDPAASLEAGVTVEHGAVIGAGAEIGRETVICANAVIGRGVKIGRNCFIGGNVTLQCSLVGDRVVIHPGASIGQDGFGFAMGAGGHVKVPQIGRVIIQDDVEIGANTTIDRGANRDTVIGEGTKIDNQVQIGHNVRIGRHCVLVAQSGVSGSSTLEDYVILAGKAGISGHLTIGAGAQIAGGSNVAEDVPPQAQWAGSPAKPLRQFVREMTRLKNLANRRDPK